MKIKLNLPFRGSFFIAWGFGELSNSLDVQIKYKEWGLRGHNGIDYGLPLGTKVLASASGKVVQVGENGDYGISITIEHSFGISLYAHLKQVSVKLNQKVRAGKVIGLSGSSGFVTGPHLHFGIKFKDADLNNGYLGFCDPAPYFKDS